MMRKLALAIVAVAMTGCGGDNSDNGAATKCTAAEKNSTKCNGDNLLECNGSIWELKENCAANDPAEVCMPTEGLTGVADCVPAETPSEEFGPCMSDAGCLGELVCTTDQYGSIFSVIDGVESEICVNECTGDVDCDTSEEYCEDEDWLAAQNFCWPKASTDGFCFSDDACPTDHRCRMVVGVSGQCLKDCPFSDRYTTSSCDEEAQEQCLPTGRYETEIDSSSGQEKTCTIGGTECNTTEELFECMEFADGYFCARPAMACGTVSPIQLDFTTDAIQAVGAAVMADPPQQTACQVPNKSWFCGAMTSENAAPENAAEVECVSLHYGYSITNSSCDASSELGNFECILGGECVDWSSGGACGFLVHACVVYCETEKGDEIENACDDGQTCGIPEASVGYMIIEGDATPTACTNVGSDVDCDSVNGFSCVEFFDGNYCARKRKVCGTNGVTAD